ncbi:MAG: methyltransferase, partial [Planctomyces sp.]
MDVVICEMLHVGLLREKQLQVIRDFKDRYLRAFGGPLPKFIPDTSLLVVQPVFQDFCFSGYHAPVPIFEPPGPQMQDRWLADPYSYATIDYETDFVSEYCVKANLPVRRSGGFNAISLRTNTLLAFDLRAGRGI